MKIALFVTAAPHSENAWHALQFCKAALARGHTVPRVFFYGDGAGHGNALLLPPQDEAHVTRDWSRLAAEHAIELVVCVARIDKIGAYRRQMLDVAEKTGGRFLKMAKDYYGKLVPFVYAKGPLSFFAPFKWLIFTLAGFFRPVPREPLGKNHLQLWAAKSTALGCENLMLAFAAYGVITFLNRDFINLMAFCFTLVGACAAFLWYNAHPAQVFMGDVGALAVGAALGTVAVIVRQEIVLLIMGGVFVMETASVILQVASFKLTGKRIFRMAPIHHHFELKGWPEPRVIVRFWIISVVLVLIGLATLKVR